MSNIKIVEKPRMNDDFHLLIQILFLSVAPKVSGFSAHRINISYNAYGIELFNQLERIHVNVRL